MSVETSFELKPDEKDVFLRVLGGKEMGKLRENFAMWASRDDAAAFIDHFQTTLDDWRTRTRALPDDVDWETLVRRGSRLLVKMSENIGELPPSLFITGIVLQNVHPVTGGGFSSIFRASYLGKAVALKRLQLFPTNPDYQSKLFPEFSREALMWRQLKHPNILPFLGVDMNTFNPMPCMVAPWMEYGHVLSYVKRKWLTVELVQNLCSDILDGLTYLHECSVVHGDLRSANILIDEEGHARLADFGISVISSLTSTKVTAQGGSARWMAPELLRVEENRPWEDPVISSAIDIYAFGCVLLELHTRNIPFSHIRHEQAVVFYIMQGNHPKRPEGRDCVVDISDALWSLLEDCWNPDPKARISVSDVKTRLRECYTDAGMTVIGLTASERDLFLGVPGSSSLGKIRGDYVVWESKQAAIVFLDRCQEALDDWRSHTSRSDKATESKLLIRRATRLLIKVSRHLQILPPSLVLSGVKLDQESADAPIYRSTGFYPGSIYFMEAKAGRGIAENLRGSYLENPVSLKRLNRFIQAPEDYATTLANFIDEALKWRQFQQPNILPFLGVDMTAFHEAPCFVSPWMAHGHVVQYLQNQSPSAELVHRLCSEILNGLTYLHDCFILHGNLKAETILIDDEEHVRLADFGASCMISEQPTIYLSRGSVRWSPPETMQLFRGDADKIYESTATDVWSYACVMLELYTHHEPYYYLEQIGAVMQEIKSGRHPNRPTPAECTIEISDPVWTFMQQCWNAHPEMRLPSSELCQRFAQCSGMDPPNVNAGDWTILQASSSATPSSYDGVQSEASAPSLVSGASLADQLESHYGLEAELSWKTYRRGKVWTAIVMVGDVEMGRGTGEKENIAKERAATQALQQSALQSRTGLAAGGSEERVEAGTSSTPSQHRKSTQKWRFWKRR